MADRHTELVQMAAVSRASSPLSCCELTMWIVFWNLLQMDHSVTFRKDMIALAL